MATIADMAFVQGRLIALFPNYRPADLNLTATIWLEILSDLPADLIKMAVMQYSGEAHDFAPSAGTVRDYAMRIRAKSAGVPDAYQAYKEVCDMPASMVKEWLGEDNGETVIFKKSLQFSHPLIEQVARLMGWPRLFPTNEPGVDRAQFVKAYDAQLSKVMADSARLPAVQQYIEAQSKNALPEVKEITKRLEMK